MKMSDIKKKPKKDLQTEGGKIRSGAKISSKKGNISTKKQIY